MSLSDLIRGKRAPGRVATATVATGATVGEENGPCVASVASVATVAMVAIDPAPSRWWRLHYDEREPVDLICVPPATHAEMLERHPEVRAAEPYVPTWRKPSAPMTDEQVAAIRRWLDKIGEHDPEVIDDVLSHCQRDADARAYFVGLALDHDQQIRGRTTDDDH